MPTNTAIAMDEDNLFKSFFPGQNFNLRPEWYRKSPVSTSRVLIQSPGRIHFSLFDYLYMKPPLPGGGGIGISTDVFTNHVEIQTGASSPDHSHLPTSAQHTFLLFKELVQYEPNDIAIAAEAKIPYAHSGYGSNVTMNTSIFWGLNRLFGEPFSNPEIFAILTHNYVESTDERGVHWGFDTGVGEASLLFGGFVLIDEACNYINHVPTKDLYTVVAKGNMATLACEDYLCRGLVENGETGEVEAQINEEVGMVHQRKHGKALKLYLNSQLIPTFNKSDYQELRAHIWQLNQLGTFKRMQLSYKKEVMLAFEAEAKNNQAVYCGISSAGPSMFAIIEDYTAAQHMKSLIEYKFSDYFDLVSVGRAGRQVCQL